VLTVSFGLLLYPFECLRIRISIHVSVQERNLAASLVVATV